MRKSKFVLFIGGRRGFPKELIQTARIELKSVMEELGHEVLLLDDNKTLTGAVETPEEGRAFAEFLRNQQGKYDGVIVSLPNFGSEGGAIEALKEVTTPILIHAYPDELDKLHTSVRRDAFCGKFALLNIFKQFNLKFTLLPPHVSSPRSTEFKNNIDYFSRLCSVVAGMKNFAVGVVGARTTTFKAVRYDEITLQRHGITVEAFDLTNLFDLVDSVSENGTEFQSKKAELQQYTSWDGVPEKALINITRLGVALDRMVQEHNLDAVAIRCWTEIQEKLGISPCVLMGLLNEHGLTAACETDVCSAVMMRALKLAGDGVTTTLDWNNNYGSDEDKCILFHCGPVPESMLKGGGQIADHELLVSSLGEGCSWGCDVGRIRPMDFTFGGIQTLGGKITCYLGEGRFTSDEIPSAFFGAAGVAHIPDLQSKLNRIGYAGHRHHTNVTEGRFSDIVKEAFEKYLDFDVDYLE